MNAAEKSELIRRGELSSLALCEECVSRIAENDQAGRELNAVACLCPDWREQAKARDEAKDKERSKKLLYGLPVLVKDNIEVKGLPNTAGSYVLKDLICEKDSDIVRRLREEGAVILGKTNLSEFAYWMSDEKMPSGYSSLAGQVRHPYNPAFDPSGSSSGSAVSVAAGYCDLAVGTETDGSLMSPAIANAITAIKPTFGLLSNRGILPLSPVQDTAGPMASSTKDCALLLSAMVSSTGKNRAADYTAALCSDLAGERIGVFTVKGTEDDEAALNRLKEIIEDHGGEAVECVLEQGIVDEEECFKTEFKYGLNRYLKEQSCSVRSLKEIIERNEADPERCLKYGQNLLIESEKTSGDLHNPAYAALRRRVKEEAEHLLFSLMEEKNLSSLVTVTNSVITNLAAVSGACSMTLPARVFNETVYDPLSFYLMAKPYRESNLIRLAYTLEQTLQLRRRPSWRK
ncbi:MAG: hypothetical protein IKD66_09940 [Solobacterium sp.]|nr:hypothetical protein [Solobacterium sp.]